MELFFLQSSGWILTKIPGFSACMSETLNIWNIRICTLKLSHSNHLVQSHSNLSI